jgi:hypothetical protein
MRHGNSTLLEEVDMFTLKKNAPEFDMVDGPYKGQKFRHGEVYADVPPGEKGRFEAAKTKPAISHLGVEFTEKQKALIKKITDAEQPTTKKKENSEAEKPASVTSPTKWKGGSDK